jgi:hypothetical protein
MKVLIENYRGWEITFCTENENFSAHSFHYDTENSKKSFAAIKKSIDDYIKDNEKFTPFFVQEMPHLYNGKKEKKIVGIRKDGLFVYENGTSKSTISTHEEGRCFLVDPENDGVFAQIADIQTQIVALEKQQKYLKSLVKKVTLKEWKEKNR